MLKAAAALAIVLPAALHFCLKDRIAAARAALGSVLGAEVAIGDAEVSFTGALVLSDVRVGDVVRAGSVEAAIGLESLFAGRFAAEEIVILEPHVHADAAALRLLGHVPRRGGAGTTRRLRRIVMRDGEVTIDLGERGSIQARDVALEPEEAGVRVVLGPSRARLRWNGIDAEAAFARAGLDVELPAARIGRAALDGGHITAGAPGLAPLQLDEVVVVRGQTTRLDGAIAGGGHLTVTLGPALGATVEADRVPLGPFAPALPSWLVPAGTLSGNVHVELDGSTVEVTASLAARGTAVNHPILALVAVPLDGRLDARVRWDRVARESDATVRLVAGILTVEGEAALRLDAAGQVTEARIAAKVPEVACAGALAALPAPLRGPLDGLDLAGNLSGRATVGFDAAHPDDTRLDFELDVGCTVLRDESGAPVEVLSGPYVHHLPDGRDRVLGAGDPDFVPLATLPAFVPAAFVAAEDSRFYGHHGFDAEQLRRSFAVDMSAGKIERGGSTISQQLVKNLYLGRERTLARKLTEAVLTWRLEARLPKARILEAYLNVIELGDGVYGIGPAATRWFGKPAARLAPAEAAYLAAVTAAPSTAEAVLRKTGQPDAEVLRRAQIVLNALHAQIGDEAYGRAVQKLAALRLTAR